MQRFTLLFLILFPILLFAQEGEWTQLNNGLNDRQALAIASPVEIPNTLYVGTASGLFRSTDHGERWQNIREIPVRAVWVSDDGRTVIIAFSGGSRSDGAWISHNGGGNFEVYRWMQWPTAIGVDPDDPDIFFMGSRQQGITYTLDGGNNWAEANQGLGGGEVHHIALKTIDDATYAFASTIAGLYRCEVDNNIRWERTGPHQLPVRQTAFSFEDDEGIYAGTDDESDSDGLYYSDNLGEEWEVQIWGMYTRAVETAPELVIMASTEVGVHRSIDGGEEWIEMNQELDDNFNITDLLIQVDDDETTVFCTNNGTGVFAYVIPGEQQDHPPSHFALLEPENEAVLENERIAFQWEMSIDPDPDEDVIYEFTIEFGDSTFEIEVEDTLLAVNQGELEMELPMHEEITWWVTAVSGDHWTECDDRFTFTIGEPDLPPEPFDLLTPGNVTVLDTGRVMFSWEVSIDPDDDEVHYDLWLGRGNDSLEAPNLVQTELPIDTRAVLGLFPGEEPITWWVNACSGNLQTECNERFTFTIRPGAPQDQPPSPFALLVPANEIWLFNTLITFLWEPSIDSDEGDTVTYQYWISNGADSVTFEDLNSTELTMDILDSLDIDIALYQPTFWWVKAISGDLQTECAERFYFVISTSVEDDNIVPFNFHLYAAYPNPFNAATKLNYAVPYTSPVSIGIYDINGSLIRTLVQGEVSAGSHIVIWNGKEAPAGIYIVRMGADDFTQVRKVILMK